MNLLKKAIAGICATAMLATFAVVPVMAEESLTVETITPTYDTIARFGNNTNYSSNSDLEWSVNGANNLYMYPIYRFAIPQTDKVIKSAKLTLVAERVKGDRNFGIYKFTTNEWITENAGGKMTPVSGADSQFVKDLKTALGGTPVTTFTAIGQNAALTVAADTINSGYTTIDKWTNVIDIPVADLTKGENLDIILNKTKDGDTSQVKFFSKEADVSKLVAKNFDATGVTNQDLIPKLEITYYPVSIGTTGYDTLADAVAAASTGTEIKIYGDVAISNRVDIKDNKAITFTGVLHNGVKPTISTGSTWIELPINQGSSLTASNINFDGRIETKNNTLNLNNCTVVNLNAGGSGDTTKVTVTDTDVTNITTYGHVNVAGSSTVTGIITISGINAGSDKPQIIVGENASVTGTLSLTDEIAAAHIGYSLVSGKIANFNATWSSGNYGLVNGAIAEKSAPAPAVSATADLQTVGTDEYMTFDGTVTNTDTVDKAGFGFVNIENAVGSEDLGAIWTNNTVSNGVFHAAIKKATNAKSSNIYAIPYIVINGEAIFGGIVPSVFTK